MPAYAHDDEGPRCSAHILLIGTRSKKPPPSHERMKIIGFAYFPAAYRVLGLPALMAFETTQPSDRSFAAISLPMPEDAPVTKATVLSRMNRFSFQAYRMVGYRENERPAAAAPLNSLHAFGESLSVHGATCPGANHLVFDPGVLEHTANLTLGQRTGPDESLTRSKAVRNQANATRERIS
ncbi:hypothetical protein ACFL6M_01220 [Candidatus Eisenbacteria bacterium]|uniref:Uncharacterized protein n=1 Tax=Eiseniibacteriota bacterium TaxID=2212470 RepID=A0ABV6YJ28_UNCEI